MDHDTRPVARRRFLLAGGLLACYGLGAATRALAADPAHDHHQHAPAAQGAHDHHQHAEVPAGVKRTEVMYKSPAVNMVRQDGTKVAFAQELDSGGPVILDFIFTTCTTVCPVTSQVFSELQGQLAKERTKPRFFSISIDAEYDTPARMREYAKKYHAGPQWQHYTGTVEASIAVQKAFDAYRGDKMNHIPVTFMRAAPGKPWIRLEGFPSPAALVKEYRDMVKVG